VDRTNELLLGETFISPGFTERYFTRVQAYIAASLWITSIRRVVTFF
jgi:hypothetical protein